MNDSVPPPTYSQQGPDDASVDGVSIHSDLSSPQVLIVPTVDAINFQKGSLGPEGERAAIEGEVQIKGALPGVWSKVTVLLRTVETSYGQDIEISHYEIVLFSDPSAIMPSSMLFSIPLIPDTPQSIRTPHSSLEHILLVTLHPCDASIQPLSKSLQVHTRRYSVHSLSIPLSPETRRIDNPTEVNIEIPRTTFYTGEPIPIYVTIPPPNRETVEGGLRLRNIRTKLVRVIKVRRSQAEDSGDLSDFDSSTDDDDDSSSAEGPSRLTAQTEKISRTRSSDEPLSPLFVGSSYRSTVSHSGAQCRFHSTRPIRMRFLLHHPNHSDSPRDFPIDLPAHDFGYYNNDAECASITLHTLLHSVIFRLHVNVSFVDVKSRTERISTVVIPITLLPPPAPLPEVAPSMDAAYQKKHDRPPIKTNRIEDHDYNSVPGYSEGQAGPSVLANGAPPPFEERDAPPPFFPEASTSSRLPTFLESESEIIIPNSPGISQSTHCSSPPIAGEGSQFGFLTSQQFDGHSQDIQQVLTPSLDILTIDANISQFSELPRTEQSMGTLGLVLDHQNAPSSEPPPPPPAMDDPSDPPPSIDSDFRSVQNTHSPPSRSSSLPHPYNQNESPSLPGSESHPAIVAPGHAPPPYLVPENERVHDPALGPPPYVD